MHRTSNTDKSGTGASVLAHRHYQAAQKRFAVFDAEVLKSRTHRSRNGHNVVIDILRYEVACCPVDHSVPVVMYGITTYTSIGQACALVFAKHGCLLCCCLELLRLSVANCVHCATLALSPCTF